MRPSALRVCLVVVLVALGGLASVPAAQAFRRPTRAEHRAVLRAFRRHEGKRAASLWVQEVRMSTHPKGYAAVLYDHRVIGLNRKPTGFGLTKIDYFRGHHRSRRVARAAQVTGFFDDFTSLGQSTPASVRDDADPLYTVTYSTQGLEHITRHSTWHCENGTTPATTSEGTYSWTSTIRNVPLSENDFKATGKGSVSGTMKPGQGCATQCNADRHFKPDGPALAQRTIGSGLGRYFHSGYLEISPGAFPDSECGEPLSFAFPVSQVEVPQPHTWFGTPDSQIKWEDLGKSHFTNAAVFHRFGDCDEIQQETYHCDDEKLDSFEGRIVADRTFRAHR